MQPISRGLAPASASASAALAPAPPTRRLISSTNSVPPPGGRTGTGIITRSTCTHPMTATVSMTSALRGGQLGVVLRPAQPFERQPLGSGALAHGHLHGEDVQDRGGEVDRRRK